MDSATSTSAVLTPLRISDGNLFEARNQLDRCWPWLLASMQEFFQTHTREQVWQRIYERRAFLWPGDKCAIVGQLVKHPIGITSFNYWLQGGKLDELKTMWPGVEAWARARGCVVVTGIGRDGWSEVMDGNWQKGPTTRIKWL